MNQKPNILLIMCDQLNASVLSCYGGPVPTPNIDSITQEGVLFRQATCPFPVCSPSRASLVTGMYPHAHKIVHNVMKRDYPSWPSPSSEEGIKQSDVTTDKLLADAGYSTHHFGKWHLLDDDLPYFPDMFTEHDKYSELMADTFQEVREQPRERWMDWYGWSLPVEVSGVFQQAADKVSGLWEGKPFAEFVAKMGRLTLPPEQVFDYMVADRTITCLQQKHVQPFMVTCSFNYPHDPNVVPSPYYGQFQPEDIELPANWNIRESIFEEDWSRQIIQGLGEQGAREFLRIYYASVKFVDDQVGRILQALRDSGQANHTIVVFTADHGDMAGGHGMIWKSTQSFYEEVVRIPLIVKYPDKIQQGTTDLAACLTDIMPTLLDFAGQPIPGHVQGHTLVPYLLAEKNPNDAPNYTFCGRIPPNPDHTRKDLPMHKGSYMVRGQGWKYMYYADGEELMYNLINDPGETNNLADKPEYKGRKKELKCELQTWLNATMV